MAKKSLYRDEINDDYKWRLEDMIASESTWEDAFKEVTSLSDEMLKFTGQLAKSSDILLECLTKRDTLLNKLTTIYVYSHMRFHENTNNSNSQSKVEKVKSLNVTVMSSLSFIEPEISLIPEKTLKKYISSSKGLLLYEHYFNNLIRKKKHILSPEQEILLAEAQNLGQGPQTIFSMFNDADIEFPTIKDENGDEVELTKGRYITFLESSDRRVRKEAFIALYSSYSKYKNTLASIYYANIKKDVFFMKARKYQSTCEASLFKNNISTDVYKQLITTVNNFLPLMHRYVSIRKKKLGLSELHMYDLYTPIVDDINIEVSFDKAKETVLKALEPLGKEYIGILKDGFKNKWIDVYENKGKRSGAYSWGTYSTHPFVLLNYQDNVNNMFTLAHEMGHALHTYYSNKAQPYIYANYPIFLAEVASTVNEALLMEYLLRTTTDKNQRLYLINYFMEQFRGTLYRQTMFAEFELMTHELVEKGEALTADKLNSLYLDLNKRYYGDEIIIDEEISIEWARIPHFYMNYYVYQYATGYCSAITLSKKILEEGMPAVNKYLDFLKSGSSDYPLNILESAGVDITTHKPFEKALDVFKELLDEMETTL